MFQIPIFGREKRKESLSEREKALHQISYFITLISVRKIIANGNKKLENWR